jgi:hypothetical protein
MIKPDTNGRLEQEETGNVILLKPKQKALKSTGQQISGTFKVFVYILKPKTFLRK